MKDGIKMQMVFISDFKEEILDADVAAEYHSLPIKKDGTVSLRSGRAMLPLLMYFDLLTLVHRDEWVSEGIETTKHYPKRWGMNG